MKGFLALAAVLLPTVVLLPAGAGPQRPASEAIVETPVALELPTGAETFQVLESVLLGARVRYGIEEAPTTTGHPLDLSRKALKTILLQGLRVREALDTIAREDPRYEWSEEHGRILVRAVSARSVGVLDMRIPRFEIHENTYPDALAALVRAMLPDEPRPAAARSGLSLQAAGGESPTQTSPEDRRISVSLQNATILEILDAIAEAHGALSWRVSYHGGGVGPEYATMGLGTPSSRFTIMSRRVARGWAAGRPKRVVIPPSGSLNTLLAVYAGIAKIQFGLEAIPEDRPGRTVGGEPLDLTDVPAALGVARIVAADARYDWADAGGIFQVRPKPAYALPLPLLDLPFESLSFENVTAEEALDRIVRLLGVDSPERGYGEGGDPDEYPRLAAASRARRFSLALGTVTLRDLLNAVCRAHGTLSWSVRPQPMTGPRRVPSYLLTLNASEGWSVSETIVLPEK